MVTMVGNESTIDKLVTNLIYLEHDAIANRTKTTPPTSPASGSRR